MAPKPQTDSRASSDRTWPDGTLEHEESLLRVERLVALVRTRHENSPEELHTGIA